MESFDHSAAALRDLPKNRRKDLVDPASEENGSGTDNGDVVEELNRPQRNLNVYTILILLVGVFGGLLFGLDIGTAASTSLSSFRETMGIPVLQSGQKDAASTTAQINEFTYVFHATCLVGAPFGGFIADRFGRKPVILIAATIFLVGAVWQSLAGLISTDFAWKSIILGRAIGGVGLGFTLTIAPVYTAELTPARWRGMGITIFQLAIVSGIFIMAIYNNFMSEYWGWRLGIALQAIPSFLLILLTVFFFPESPRYLIKVKRYDEAEAALRRLAQGTPDAEKVVSFEMQQIKDEQAEEDAAGEGGFFELFRGENLVSVLCAGTVAFSQNVTGITWFLNYATTLFNSLGFDAFTFDLILKAISVAFTLVVIPLIDNVGRKPLLIWGTTFTMVAFFLIAVVISASGVNVNTDDADSKTYAVQIFSVIMIYLFQTSYSLTWGAIGWIVPAESFSLRVRGVGMAFCVSMNFFTNILLGDVGYDRIYSATNLQITCFILVVTNFFIAFPAVTLFQPETKDLGLEDLRKVFAYSKGGNEERGFGTIRQFIKRNLTQTAQIYCFKEPDRTIGFERFKDKAPPSV
eukprot:CAMPEP_0171497026 /NCGR_PEP_ID=MMETSP0958-20121227/7036_1 /TAXON_ID=87120 /ORGANISM="Aurantiochytrium limacinum, Strain ATCCMYA-1381" /LENGTH=577 /DNA_ID=CAMNT_0012031209 /DNA_START=710 /DNA_END=2443 /DNA_ORIENTATION=+